MRTVQARALLAIALVVSLLSSTEVGAAMSSPQVLSGRNVLTVDRPSGLSIYLPKKVSMSLEAGDNPDVTVEGTGRVAGFVLVANKKDTWVGVMRWSDCREPGCTGSNYFEHPFSYGLKTANRSVVIPAGNYRLYVLTDEAAVRIAFDLKGLSGRSDLRAAARTTAAIFTPDWDLPVAGGTMTASYEHRMPAPGLLLAAKIDGGGVGAHVETQCYSRGRPPEATDVADPSEDHFCGAGAGYNTLPGARISWYLVGSIKKGRWWAEYTGGRAESSDRLLTDVWLSFDRF